MASTFSMKWPAREPREERGGWLERGGSGVAPEEGLCKRLKHN